MNDAEKPAYKHRITAENVEIALEAFAADTAQHRFFDTLLGFLVNADRPDEARLVLDLPGQRTARALEVVFQKVSHARAKSWSLAFFEAFMQRPPTLPPATSDDSLTLSFLMVEDHEVSAARTLELIIGAYGVNLPLKYGQTLLHAVAASANTELIRAVLDAGADAQRRNDFDETPFDALLGSTSFGHVDAESLRRLSPGGRFPKKPALSSFLLSAAASGAVRDSHSGERGPRVVGEILEVVHALIELGATGRGERETPSALGAALRLPLPASERHQVVDVLLEAKCAGATLHDALPEVVKGYDLDALTNALELAKHTPGATFGKSGNTLLHVAITKQLEWWGGEFVEQRLIPVVELLLKRGEPTDAKNARGKTAFEVARREKAVFAPHWERLAALLHRETRASPRLTSKKQTGSARSRAR